MSGSATKQERATGYTLQQARLALFRKQGPLCVHCLAKTPPITRAWTQRDHIVPLHQGGLDAPENTQGLCDECHLRKSKQERGHTFKPRRVIGLDGYPHATDESDARKDVVT